MQKRPNPADFSVMEKPNEYEISIQVAGEICSDGHADSVKQARAEAEKIASRILNGSEYAELDGVDDVAVGNVRKTPPMFRVMRDGVKMQVSILCAGDTPREPDEFGF